MKVYFYHTQDIQMILQRNARGEFPAHFLYGATLLPEHGIEVVWHKARLGLPRWRMMLRNAWQVLMSKEPFDAVYATHYRGLELIVFLRALRLFRKPLVVWHHQPIVSATGKRAGLAARLRHILGKLFYRGFDQLFFFSQKLVDESIATGKYPAERMHIGHWGWAKGELEGLSKCRRKALITPLKGAHNAVETTSQRPLSFISTGKEMRDMPTLISAFNQAGAPLDIYISERNGDQDYRAILSRLTINDNISINYQAKLAPYELSQRVQQAACVCICCQETKYTVGLTTLVEALALGKPMICSRNSAWPIDLEQEGCGLLVDYPDCAGRARPLNKKISDPFGASLMGHRAKALADEQYNNETLAEEVAAVLKAL